MASSQNSKRPRPGPSAVIISRLKPIPTVVMLGLTMGGLWFLDAAADRYAWDLPRETGWLLLIIGVNLVMIVLVVMAAFRYSRTRGAVAWIEDGRLITVGGGSYPIGEVTEVSCSPSWRLFGSGPSPGVWASAGRETANLATSPFCGLSENIAGDAYRALKAAGAPLERDGPQVDVWWSS